MEIRRHDDVASFAELAMPMLQADPVRHTVAVTVLASRLRAGSARADLTHLITVHENGQLAGAALQARSWSMIVSALPARYASAVADALATHGPEPAGASGPRPRADPFADAWQARTGQGRRGEMAQRLFALGTLTPPAGVPGAARVATLDDVTLLAGWSDDFAEAALPPQWPRASAEDIARMMDGGYCNVLWELDGEPVAMAATRAPTAAMSRIGPVWTPPRHRNRGFGSAVTAAAARWALDAGAEHVVLFTDLANPVSNAIYPRIGFRPLFDAVELSFAR